MSTPSTFVFSALERHVNTVHTHTHLEPLHIWSPAVCVLASPPKHQTRVSVSEQTTEAKACSWRTQVSPSWDLPHVAAAYGTLVPFWLVCKSRPCLSGMEMWRTGILLFSHQKTFCCKFLNIPEHQTLASPPACSLCATKGLLANSLRLSESGLLSDSNVSPWWRECGSKSALGWREHVGPFGAPAPTLVPPVGCQPACTLPSLHSWEGIWPALASSHQPRPGWAPGGQGPPQFLGSGAFAAIRRTQGEHRDQAETRSQTNMDSGTAFLQPLLSSMGGCATPPPPLPGDLANKSFPYRQHPRPRPHIPAP